MDATPPAETSANPAVRRRIRLTARIKDGLRDLSIQLALLSHQVGTHLDLRDTDLECLDLVSRFGPIGPTALSKRAGMHPATLTGVLDRLERGGWVVRTPNPTDRRSILVKVVQEKEAEVAFMFSGLDTAMDGVCAEYEDADLMMIADFLLRTAKAGRAATDDLAANGQPSVAGS
jgi:DNA-binding MarR family transcriptional regulator